MVFEGGKDTERWIRDENLFMPPHQGCWLKLAAHLIFKNDGSGATRSFQYTGPYKETPCCSVHLWSPTNKWSRRIVCWCGEKWWDSTSNVERLAEHLWVSNENDPGGLDQHYRQGVATRMLGAM
jgi:hypothetical protein